MLVLAIDTSTKIGTVALYDKYKGIVAEIILNSGNNHSENIMSSIDDLFKLSKKKIEEVDRIAVSTGPGSFTGIRIGVAVAKGLAYSLGAEIVGINELDLIAALSEESEKNIIALIDARKERTYFAGYRYVDGVLKRVTEYRDGDLLALIEEYRGEPTLFLGDGALNYKDLISAVMKENGYFARGILSVPRAGLLAELAAEREPDNLMILEPYYVNKSQAEREKEEQKNS